MLILLDWMQDNVYIDCIKCMATVEIIYTSVFDIFICKIKKIYLDNLYREIVGALKIAKSWEKFYMS